MVRPRGFHDWQEARMDENDEVAKARRLLQQVRARARWAQVTPEQRKAHAEMMAAARWAAKERNKHANT